MTNNTETMGNHAHIVIMKKSSVAGVSIGNPKLKNTTIWKGDNMGVFLLDLEKKIADYDTAYLNKPEILKNDFQILFKLCQGYEKIISKYEKLHEKVKKWVV